MSNRRWLRALSLLPFLIGACELHINGGSYESFSASSYSFQTESSDGSLSIYIRGTGSSKWTNNKLKSLGDGSRLYLRRKQGADDSEILLYRDGVDYFAAARHGLVVSALNDQDRKWLEERIAFTINEIKSAPGIEHETARIEAIHRRLTSSAPFDFANLQSDLDALLFPTALTEDFQNYAKRENLSENEEVSLLRFLCNVQKSFTLDERDRIAAALASRPNLSTTAIELFFEESDCASYAKRSSIALQLVAKKNLTPHAAQRLIKHIDNIPYNDRSDVLTALYERGNMVSGRDWLDAVLENAPYNERSTLLQKALSQKDLTLEFAQAVWRRIDDVPYNDRSEVLLDTLKAPVTTKELPALVNLILEDLPYNERWRTLKSLYDSKEFGLACCRETLRKMDGLPYNQRSSFLELFATRTDLTQGDQSQLVEAISDDAPYATRGRILVKLLQNPACTAETKEWIKKHRKDMAPNQRELIEEHLMK